MAPSDLLDPISIHLAGSQPSWPPILPLSPFPVHSHPPTEAQRSCLILRQPLRYFGVVSFLPVPETLLLSQEEF